MGGVAEGGNATVTASEDEVNHQWEGMLWREKIAEILMFNVT